MNMRVLRRFRNIFNGTLGFLALISALLLLFIMLGICAEVTTRVLGSSIKWMMEVVEYSLLFMTFFGAAWLLKSEGHVIMDIVVTRLRPRVRYLLNFSTSCLCSVVCLVVTWYGIESTFISAHRGSYLGTILEPPLYILLAVVPFGFLFLSIQFLLRTYAFLQKLRALKAEGEKDVGKTLPIARYE